MTQLQSVVFNKHNSPGSARSNTQTVVLLGGAPSQCLSLTTSLRALGIFMGPCEGTHCADPNFNLKLKRLRSPSHHSDNQLIKAHFDYALAHRNGNHTSWGFCAKFDQLTLDWLTKRLRDPCFILPLPNALPRAIETAGDLGLLRQRVLLEQVTHASAALNFLDHLDQPALVFDPKAAEESPHEWLSTLGSFLNAKPKESSSSTVTEHHREGKHQDTRPGKLPLGCVENIEPQKVTGWARGFAHPKTTAKVQLLIDGQIKADAFANGSRPELRRARQAPSAECGFVIELPQREKIQAGQEIRVVEAASGQDLIGSGLFHRPGLLSLVECM